MVTINGLGTPDFKGVTTDNLMFSMSEIFNLLNISTESFKQVFDEEIETLKKQDVAPEAKPGDENFMKHLETVTAIKEVSNSKRDFLEANNNFRNFLIRYGNELCVKYNLPNKLGVVEQRIDAESNAKE